MYSREGKPQQQELGEQGQQMLVLAMKALPDNNILVENAAEALSHILDTLKRNSLGFLRKMPSGLVIFVKALAHPDCVNLVDMACALLQTARKLAINA